VTRPFPEVRRVDVVDAQGRLMDVLTIPGGAGRLTWDPRAGGLTPGVYFLRERETGRRGRLLLLSR